MRKNAKKICCLCGKDESILNGSKFIQGKIGYVCSSCIKEAVTVLDEEDEEDGANKQDIHMKATPSQIKLHLDQYVIGQGEAKRTLAVAVYNHYKRINRKVKSTDVEVQKSNVLMLGSTGSGKTYLVQSLAKYLDVPFTIADATALTEAGYVGEDVENILQRLLEAAGYDAKLAEQGIVYIDEIDKIARKAENNSVTRDISGEGVQQALLKIIEGTVSSVPICGGKNQTNCPTSSIDTSNILFICGGAFDGLELMINENSNSIGFQTVATPTDENDRTLKNIEPQDIVKYGLMPEFVGRLPIITTLQPLSEDDLCKILTEPKNALVKQYQSLLAIDGIKLVFQPDALTKIATLASQRGTGARGLRSIIEKSMRNVMYEIPDIKGAKKVVITSRVIDGTEQAIIYGSKNIKIA